MFHKSGSFDTSRLILNFLLSFHLNHLLSDQFLDKFTEQAVLRATLTCSKEDYEGFQFVIPEEGWPSFAWIGETHTSSISLTFKKIS
jgi:hypothetical protein